MYAIRLQNFLNSTHLKQCSNSGFGGSCITDPIISDLWHLHYEVSIHLSVLHNCLILPPFQQFLLLSRTSTKVILREFFQIKSSSFFNHERHFDSVASVHHNNLNNVKFVPCKYWSLIERSFNECH